MARKRIAKKGRRLCIAPNCGKAANGYRGLCSGCYQAAHRAVAAEEITWEDLERRGLALADGRKNMAPRTALGKALAS